MFYPRHTHMAACGLSCPYGVMPRVGFARFVFVESEI